MEEHKEVRVLVVDDDVHARESLANWLRRAHKYAVDTAENGKRAIARVQEAKGRYDVVLMDQELLPRRGELSGLETMKAIKAEYSDLPVVIITGYGDSNSGIAAMREGAYRYILKTDRVNEEIAILIRSIAEQQRLKSELERTVRERSWLKSLLDVSNAMQSALEVGKVLETIAEAVRKLLGFSLVAVSTIGEDKMVRVRALAGLDGDGKNKLADLITPWEIFSHPMQERFRVSRSYLIRHENYDWGLEYKGEVYIPDLGERTEGEWHCKDALRVPIVTREGRTIGILSVDDPIDRRLPSLETIQALEMFATQAAIAIENANLFQETRDRLRRLHMLSRAINEMTSSLSTMPMNKRLNLIVRRAAKILEAETSGIFLVKREGYLSLEASYGHRKGHFQKGREFKIESGPKAGLTGHIAHEGKLFNAHGDRLVNHWAVKEAEPTHEKSGHCYSLLAIPLKTKIGQQEKLIGLLRVSNKKGKSGQTGPEIGFSQEDEWVLSTLAEAIVVAIEAAGLVQQLDAQKDHFSRLVAGSFDGIVTIDTHGLVTEFNAQAEHIMGYSAEEVLGKSISCLYCSPAEPRRIGKRLFSNPSGQLTDYETFVRSKTGEKIPVRLSATWLFDVQGRRLGSAGYFKDLRPIIEAEKRLKTLLGRVNQELERRRKEQEATQMVARLLGSTFDPGTVWREILYGALRITEAKRGRLFRLDTYSGQWVVEIKKGFAGKGAIQACPVSPATCCILRQVVQGKVAILVDDTLQASCTKCYLHHLPKARSILAVPIKDGDDIVGMMQLESARVAAFTEDDLRLTESLAVYAAMAMQNARRYREMEQNAVLRKCILQAAQEITTLQPLPRLLKRVASATRRALKADVLTLYGYDASKDEIGYPAVTAGRLFAPGGMTRFERVDKASPVGKVLEMGEPYYAECAQDNPILCSPDGFVLRERISSSAGIPLLMGREKVGILFINYRKKHSFPPEERQAIQILANQAAVAIHNTRLFEARNQKLKEQELLRGLSHKQLGTVDLQTTMDRAIAIAAEVFGAPLCDIVLPDEHGNLTMQSAVGWRPDYIGTYKFPKDRGSQTGYTIMLKKPVFVDDFDKETRFDILPIVGELGMKSGMSVPMFRGKKVVGAMLVHTMVPRHFTPEEARLLSLIADQTAIAMQSAQQYADIQKKSEHLKAVYEASKAIATGFTVERKPVLDCIAREAVERITGIYPPKANLGIIQLYDQAANELRLESVYPPQEFPNLVARIGETRPLDPSKAPGGRIGIKGRAVLSRQPQLAKDVKSHHDYHEINPATRSELDVPLLDGDTAIGVLGVESDALNAFDEEDERTLQALAELAVIVIKNAEQQSKLLKMREQIARKEALSLLGMIRSTWVHRVRGDAASIRDGVELLLKAIPSEGPFMEVRKIVDQIGEQARDILAVEMGGASEEELIESVGINALLGERALLLYRRYGDIILEWGSRVDDSVTVRADRKWLRTAVDHLIQNALDAMSKITTEKRLTVSTLIKEDKTVGILIRDTGPGIPLTVLEKLGVSDVPKKPGEKGTGTGWLVVRTIAERFGGSANVVETGPGGTVVRLSFPMEHY
jgi:PAS domain S-box-containing protein